MKMPTTELHSFEGQFKAQVAKRFEILKIIYLFARYHFIIKTNDFFLYRFYLKMILFSIFI